MNAVWNALADPTRRAILDLLRERPRTSGDLASHFPTTRFATRKHLNALEAAGLVLVRREGRERWNYLNAAPLQMIYERWVTPYQAIWAERATKLKVKLEKGKAMTPSRTATVARVELEIPIKAPAADVWRALLEDTTLWWPREFYTGAAKGFHIEPRLGGRVYEDWATAATAHGAVSYQVFGLPHPRISLTCRDGNGRGLVSDLRVSMRHLIFTATKARIDGRALRTLRFSAAGLELAAAEGRRAGDENALRICPSARAAFTDRVEADDRVPSAPPLGSSCEPVLLLNAYHAAQRSAHLAAPWLIRPCGTRGSRLELEICQRQLEWSRN